MHCVKQYFPVYDLNLLKVYCHWVILCSRIIKVGEKSLPTSVMLPDSSVPCSFFLNLKILTLFLVEKETGWLELYFTFEM